MNQTEAFTRWFGDIWYDSNINELGKDDPVSMLIEAINLHPKRVLEIGCSNGWRLKRLKDKYGCEVTGVDPSEKAISAGESWDLFVGTADNLEEVGADGQFDVIIYGFCFSFIDPNDYFKVLAEGNRVLQDGGMVLLYDRPAVFPMKQQYAEVKTKDQKTFEVFLHFMDWQRLWLAHPFYTTVNELRHPETFDVVYALRKNVKGAFFRAAHVFKDVINHDKEGNKISVVAPPK